MHNGIHLSGDKYKVRNIMPNKQKTRKAKIAAKKAKSRELKRKNSPARASSTDPEARVTKMPDGSVIEVV